MKGSLNSRGGPVPYALPFGSPPESTYNNSVSTFHPYLLEVSVQDAQPGKTALPVWSQAFSGLGRKGSETRRTIRRCTK